MAQAVSSTERPSSRRTTLTLALSMLLAALGTSIANIALPTLVQAFDAPFAQVQAVVVAYLAALTLSAVIVGRLGDLFGLRLMFLAGLTLFAAASLLCGIAPNLWLLIAARALQGFGAAFLMTLTMALMRETAGENQMGKAMGLLGTMSALGTALGPSLGGLMLSTLGWRGVFLVQVPLACLAIGLAIKTLPADRPRQSAGTTSIFALLTRQLVPSLAVNVIVAAVMMTTLVIGPFYLGIGLALPTLLVGLVMSVGPVMSILGGVPTGWAVDRWGTTKVLASGLALLTLGTILLATLPALFGVSGYIMAIVVLTPGYQLFQSANNTAVLADIPKQSRGTVSGLLSLSRNAGLILGASAMGAIFASGVGTSELAQAMPSAIASGMQLTFGVAAALMVLACVIASLRARA
ncbi:MFS transporter [Devosia epidermidihirudinis]|uniref:MFS transporter n=1 Tax=Devosia epidermidihirudinis TaxID=1293439 RepID=A0A0F5Q462_9HYPH|nr:MFS transporter [Devosia epidermidihirudinis]KKC35655.1 MFS transporter [Devosia epidermidihirudinis]